MQQKQIWKVQQRLINHKLLKSVIASLKPNVDKLDINKLKNVPTNLINLKIKVSKLDVAKLVLVPVDLSKLSYIVKIILSRKMYIMLRYKILEIKYLKLWT